MKTPIDLTVLQTKNKVLEREFERELREANRVNVSLRVQLALSRASKAATKERLDAETLARQEAVAELVKARVNLDPLVKAFRETSARNEELQRENEALKQRLDRVPVTAPLSPKFLAPSPASEPNGLPCPLPPSFGSSLPGNVRPPAESAP